METIMPAAPTAFSALLTDTLAAFGMNADGHDKPRLLVSACLLGEPVRYDGDDKHDPLVTETLAHWFDYQPMCPEVGIGMPVPRPPIQVVSVAGRQRVHAVAPPHEDASDALRQYALNLPAAIDGILLKARSPSCGVGSTPLYTEQGEDTGQRVDGLVAATLGERFPALARSDEQALSDPGHCLAFVIHCLLYRQWRTQQAGDAELVHWQQVCRQQGSPHFQVLAQRLQHWRGRP